MSSGDDIAAVGNAVDVRRLPDLYWRQIEQLAASAIAMRLYLNKMHRRVRAVELIKAFAGNGAIAAWVVFRDHPFVWSGIIGAAQFLDAIKGIFPFVAIHRQASNFTATLELLLIDAQEQWDRMYAGTLTEPEIRLALSRLRRLRVEAEHKHFPDGVEVPDRIIVLATLQTREYFIHNYAQEPGK
jgi:hypothetical protein